MKRTLLTILITAVITSGLWNVWFSFSRALDRFKMFSTVQVPGRMALDDIRAELAKGRYNVAEAKVLALKRHWNLFEADGLRGEALGRVMVTFSQVDPDVQRITNTEHSAPAIGSQPVRPETNSTSPAAGSSR
jgi:hypothetical protein